MPSTALLYPQPHSAVLSYKATRVTLVNSCWLFSSHLLLFPNNAIVFIIYSVPPHTKGKLYACRRYQHVGFITETSSTDAPSSTIITPVHTLNKAFSFAPYEALLLSTCHSIQLQSWRGVYAYVHVRVYI